MFKSKFFMVCFSLGLANILCACATQTEKIERHMLNSWEPEIGYAQVVQAGNTFHISGVTCEGDYASAVNQCYKTLGDILQKFHLTAKNVVKENIYALDIEAVKKQIPERKKFYTDGQYPAATWVQVSRLYNPENVIEIELVAVK